MVVPRTAPAQVATGADSSPAAAAAAGDPDSATAGPAAALAEALAAGDVHYARRGEDATGDGAPPFQVDGAIAEYRRALALDPRSLDARLRIMRAYFFRGGFCGAMPAPEKQALFDEAKRVADDTVADLDRMLRRKKARVRLDGVKDADAAAEAYVWAAVSWGQWANFHRVAAAWQGAPARIRDLATAVLSIDPGTEQAAAYIILGRLHTEAPRVPMVTGWVSREKGLGFLRDGHRLAPQNQALTYFLGNALLDLDPSARAEARALLEACVAAAPAAGLSRRGPALRAHGARAPGRRPLRPAASRRTSSRRTSSTSSRRRRPRCCRWTSWSWTNPCWSSRSCSSPTSSSCSSSRRRSSCWTRSRKRTGSSDCSHRTRQASRRRRGPLRPRAGSGSHGVPSGSRLPGDRHRRPKRASSCAANSACAAILGYGALSQTARRCRDGGVTFHILLQSIFDPLGSLDATCAPVDIPRGGCQRDRGPTGERAARGLEAGGRRRRRVVARQIGQRAAIEVHLDPPDDLVRADHVHAARKPSDDVDAQLAGLRPSGRRRRAGACATSSIRRRRSSAAPRPCG